MSPVLVTPGGMAMTSFTASSLYSGVNSRCDLAIVNVLSCEEFTQRSQGQIGS